jgi:hypothetical protein
MTFCTCDSLHGLDHDVLCYMSVTRSRESYARTCGMAQDLQTVGLLSTIHVDQSMIAPARGSSSVFDEDTLLGEQLRRGDDKGMGGGCARYVVQVESI